MWVLARNVTEFNLLYDEEVHVKLEEMGFKNGDREPVASYQGSDCVYEDTASSGGGGLSEGEKIGLTLIIIICIGIFVVAVVMFVKNRDPVHSSRDPDADEESVHLVNGRGGGSTANPLSDANAKVMEEGNEGGL
jgi:hypothetical protein